ncbi:hypothetical protein O6P43_004207 [Quillaja saponaria]|uniref:Uncharacterized protein n=1 Tax=Quillaja saponaria TaxID=32244 RepID=A0AAD7VFL8_QUISA|nr:hypothetical protein O6P43_004207 [Quillaja saponaria]
MEKEQDQLENLSNNEEQEEEAVIKKNALIVNKYAVRPSKFSGNLKLSPAAGGANSVVVYMPCCSLVPRNSADFDLVMNMLEGYGVQLVVQNISLPENDQTSLPIVFVEGRCFAGVKEVMKFHNSGEIRKILSTSTSVMNDNKGKTIYQGFDNCPLHTADDVVLLYTRCSTLGTGEKGDSVYLMEVMKRYPVEIEVRDNSLCKNHEGLLKPFQENNNKVVLPIVFVNGRCLGGKIEVLKLNMRRQLDDILMNTSAEKNDNNKGKTIFASFDYRKNIKQNY